MKRLATLFLAAAFVLTALAPAHAVEVRVYGHMDFGFGYSDDSTFQKRNEDDFWARQRARITTEFIANEHLKGVVQLQIGKTITWGRTTERNIGTGSGGALDTDGNNIQTRRAYISWLVPNTGLSISMGLQNIALPSATFGNPVFNANAAGVVAGYKFNNNFTLTGFWARPWDMNDSAPTGDLQNDNADLFGAILSMSFDNFTLQPWFVYGSIGNASGFWQYRGGAGPAAGPTNAYGSATLYTGGAAFELSLLNALGIKVDAMYGQLDNEHNMPETKGWMVSALVDYKLGFGTPGIFGWYASGDDWDDVQDNEFGRLPIVGNDGGFYPMRLGFPGSVSMGDDSYITTTGVGTWGLGLQIADMSFINKLSHTVRVGYYQGTNDEDVIKLGGIANAPAILGETIYMTKKDKAWEVDLDSRYDIFENLAVYLELGYIYLDMDKDVWGDTYNAPNAWNAQMIFQFKF